MVIKIVSACYIIVAAAAVVIVVGIDVPPKTNYCDPRTSVA